MSRRLYFLLLTTLVGLPAQASDLIALRTAAVRGAVDRVRDAVVQLQPFGGGGGVLTDATTSPTTGLLLTDDGLIVTSSHGFDPPPTSIVVRYDDGSRAAGTLLGIDHNRRLALVEANRVPTGSLQVDVAPPPRVGETAIAVGRTFRAEEPNLAVGIVSALGRFYGRAVQTDAAASPANYGGPLVDLQGRVLGIITPLAADGEGPDAGTGWYDSGIGFAVPIRDVRARIERLRRGEAIHRGLAGVAFASGQEYTAPPKLAAVHPGGPADNAGLQIDDVITAIDGEPITTVAAYRAATNARDDGASLTIRADRDGESIEVELFLAAELTPYRHAYLGLTVQDVANTSGAEIVAIVDNAPADGEDLVVGDRVTAIDGDKIATRGDLLNRLKAITPGDKVRLTIDRQGETLTEEITSSELAYEPLPASGETFQVNSSQLVVPGSEQKATLFAPVGAKGSRPAVVWLGGERDSEAIEKIAAAGCVLVRLEEPIHAESPDALKAYLSDLLDLLVPRSDVDEQRIAIGGAGRQSAPALTLGQRMRGRTAGVVLSHWTARSPRVSANTPSDRLGFLVMGQDKRSVAVGELIEKQGYPVHRSVEEAVNPQTVAAWLASLDRL